VVSSSGGATQEADTIDGYEGLAPVDALAGDVSADGIVGMAGNAREWVADVYDVDYYAHSPTANPRGPAGSGLRVVRGGSYLTSAGQLRGSARAGAPETLRSVEIGVRCAYDRPD
jgi:formylglycine-generating enzyme required for sulfatase activity